MPKITYKAVNAALENIKYIRKCYAPIGSNCVAMVGYIEKAVARKNEEGKVGISIYAYGEAKPRDDYCIMGNGYDITNIIIEWAFPWHHRLNIIPEDWKSERRRKEVVRLIANKLNAVNTDKE